MALVLALVEREGGIRSGLLVSCFHGAYDDGPIATVDGHTQSELKQQRLYERS